jgi:acyl carrier protein
VFARSSLRSIRNELIKVIQENTPEFIGEVTDTTSLIQSGLVDSQRLVNLAMLVEREIGHPMDFSDVDLAREWDTIADVIRFIEKQRDAR